MESSIDKPKNINKAESNYWPYLIKLNQFNKIIKDKNIFIRLGLSSSSQVLFQYYTKEDPKTSLYKLSLNIKELYDLDDYFKSMKTIDEVYTNIFEVLNKGGFNIEFSNSNSDSIALVLLCDKKEIKINLNKQNISFLNEYDCELNEFINQLYKEVMTLKSSLNSSSNNKSDEDKETIRQLKEENKYTKKRLEKIEKEYFNQKNEINSLKKAINSLKNNKNKGTTNSKNYPRKQDLINNNNNNINNINNINNNENDDDYSHANTTPYYNYMPDYYNNSYYYYQDYINSIQNDDRFQNINDYVDDYYNNDEEEDSNSEEIESDNNIYYNNNENNQYDYNYQNSLYYNMENQNQINNDYNSYLYPNKENSNYQNENISENSSKEQSKIIEDKKLDVVEFNKRYQTKYKDNKMKKLDLGSKKLGNIILSEIPKFDFNNVIKLYLCDNDITNIKYLILWKNPNLEKLYFSNNKIKDISVLSKVNFSNLQILYLDNNLLTDISCLSNVNFPNLYTLSLHNNKISDISVFEKVNFKYLYFLSLHDNNISDISAFKRAKFSYLEILFLNNNHINDLSCFENINSFNLKQLHLCGNEIDQEKNKNVILSLKKKLEDFQI